MPLKEIIIPRDAVGQRVADYLRSALPDLPESVLRRIFASRDVKLDSIRVSRDQRLQEGQCLKIYIPDASAGSSSAAVSRASASASSRSTLTSGVSSVFSSTLTAFSGRPLSISIRAQQSAA